MKKAYYLTVVIVAFSISIVTVYSAPAPWGLALNHETKECAGYWAGDEFSYYELPDGWEAYYPSLPNNSIEIETGQCNFRYREYEGCCNQLGYTYVSENIGELRNLTLEECNGLLSSGLLECCQDSDCDSNEECGGNVCVEKEVEPPKEFILEIDPIHQICQNDADCVNIYIGCSYCPGDCAAINEEYVSEYEGKLDCINYSGGVCDYDCRFETPFCDNGVCSLSTCGDGRCKEPEDLNSCPEDCAIGGPQIKCGDNICQDWELTESHPGYCPNDCPTPPPDVKPVDSGNTLVYLILGVLIGAYIILRYKQSKK